jgi:ABC-type Zn uptake system ZnuABC Zn-binding protein ZnuA
VREMNDADLWIQVGNDIEAAWYPDLISNVKNTKILDGQEGFLDLSQGVMELEGVVGKALGASQSSGLHPSGNPHYLLDPIEGIRAGKMILDRLIALVPSQQETFQGNFTTFRQTLSEALIGQALAERHDIVEIADHYLNDTLSTFLAEQDHNLSLEGWLGALDKHRGTVIVGDHDLWPYFARRVGLSVLGYFEPEPGVPPTTKHLRILMDEMKTQSVSVIFSAPYFDARHGIFVSENTGARVLPMCHQTQARTDTSSYFDMIRHNMETVIQALSQ